ncbi:hypothetical protein [Alkalicoccus halolimnae]|uniref:Uncharacterized protein n=1 Tax=Alkalicoccus halolimnae TaxID=1667239 RepID=A0A5C7F0B2_9BACI|nr:hypothetical protein [Alkalicoccus halolimnae]TXF82567.1 hypothetical protein FTX54_14625 [Alkalicoccus halolimnae]
MRMKLDYEAAKKMDGQTTEQKVPGVIVTDIPDDKEHDEAFIKERLKEITEDPNVKLTGYEKE